MSSHHIVRDAQEPALVIIDSRCNIQLVKNLLEWSPTVIVSSELVDFVIVEGFKIDVVIGKSDEIRESMEKLQHQAPVKFLTKNEVDNDVLQSLYFLTAAKYKAVNILVSMNVEKLDLIMPFTNTIDIVIYDNRHKWYFCKDNSFKKWVSKGATFRFLKELDITLNGTELTLSKPQTGYNCICPEEGFITITNNKSGFWLGEAI